MECATVENFGNFPMNDQNMKTDPKKQEEKL